MIISLSTLFIEEQGLRYGFAVTHDLLQHSVYQNVQEVVLKLVCTKFI